MFHEQHRHPRPVVPHSAVSDAVCPVVPSRSVSGEEALDDLVKTLRDERGFAEPTLQNRRRSLTPFLAWLGARGRSWQATTLEDVTAYLASHPRWSRATVAFHVQSLRTLFRHGATRR